MWKSLVWKAHTLWAIYEKKKCEKKWIALTKFHIQVYYDRFYRLQGLGVVEALLPGFPEPKVVLHPGVWEGRTVSSDQNGSPMKSALKLVSVLWDSMWSMWPHLMQLAVQLGRLLLAAGGPGKSLFKRQKTICFKMLEIRVWAANIPRSHSRLVHHDGWDCKLAHFCSFLPHQLEPQRKYWDSTMAKCPDPKGTSTANKLPSLGNHGLHCKTCH